MVKLLKQMYTGVKFSGSSTTVFTWTSSTSLCLWEPWRESPKTVHHYISTCNSPTVFIGFSTIVFTCASSVSLCLQEPWGVFQDCSSLHQYMRFTNSVHWILLYCVHLHLFDELHLFITTSQCSLHSPPLCSPAPLWRTTSLHHYITVFTAFSLPLGSPSLQGATSGDHNMGESQCSGFFPLLWSSASLYQTSLFITAWGKSPTIFIFIIKMLVDYTIMRGLAKITAKENPFAGFPLPLCSPALLHWTTSLCHYMRRVSSISLSLHERDLQQSLILTASGFTSTSSLHYISSSLHEESLRHLFVTTWEGSPTVTDSHCLWIHQHFFTELHLFVITRGESPASTWEGSPIVADSHCLWVHHLSGELQHYRGDSPIMLAAISTTLLTLQWTAWLHEKFPILVFDRSFFYLVHQHLFFAEQCSLDSPVAVCFIFTPSTAVACVLFASLIKLAAFLLGQGNETLKDRKLSRWLNFILLFIVFVKMWWDCQCFSSKRESCTWWRLSYICVPLTLICDIGLI